MPTSVWDQQDKPGRRLGLQSRRKGRILGAKFQVGVSPGPGFSCWPALPREVHKEWVGGRMLQGLGDPDSQDQSRLKYNSCSPLELCIKGSSAVVQLCCTL